MKRFLPMAGHTRGNRSPVTCALKCGNACAHPVPNASGNPHFREIAEAAISRRSALGLGGGVAAAVVLANAPEAAADNGIFPKGGGKLPFTAIDVAGRVLGMTIYYDIDATVPRMEIGYTWNRASAHGTGTNADTIASNSGGTGIPKPRSIIPQGLPPSSTT